MPRKAVLSTQILEGRVSIYKTNQSPFYQCGFRMTGVHIRQSTKTTDLAEAKEFATEAYLTARIKAKEGIPVVTRSFKSVAELVIADMEQKFINSEGKKTYRVYIYTIKRWLLPFFKTRHINKIDYAVIKEFDQWRLTRFGKLPSRGSINMMNVALNYVFDMAVDRGFISRLQVPLLKNDGKKADRRPDFTIAEYRKLYTHMRKWITEGKKGIALTRRHMMRDYVLFLANTGVRTGTETKGLKWKHIRLEVQDGVEYVLVNVDGKTGKREAVARHSIVRPLERLLHRQTKYADKSLREALSERLDDYVFAFPNGKECANYIGLFKVFLNSCDLLEDPRTGTERTLYSLRHFFITQSLLRGTPAAAIAKQCGTSIQMIDDFYSHVTALLSAKSLAGKTRLNKKPEVKSGLLSETGE